METTENNLPSTLSYSDDDVSRQVAKKLLKEGHYAIICVSNLPEEAGTGSLRFSQRFLPLKDPDDQDSKGNISVNNWMTLPFATEKKPTAPNTLGMCVTQLTAMGGEIGDTIPAYPRKENGVFTYDGNEITKDEVEAARVNTGKATMEAIKKIWDDPSQLEGLVCYAYVKVENGYNKISRFYAELPEGESVVDSEAWFT